MGGGGWRVGAVGLHHGKLQTQNETFSRERRREVVARRQPGAPERLGSSQSSPQLISSTLRS